MEENKVLINMVDGGLISVDYQGLDCISSGCETCGYGGHWINNIEIRMVNGIIDIEMHSMYDWIDVIEEDKFMFIITSNIDNIKNMTEKEFAKWIKEQLINSNELDEDYINQLEVKYCEEM